MPINRPDTRNAIDDATRVALAQCLAEFAKNDAIRCVVFTGTGSAFCAGVDLGDTATTDAWRCRWRRIAPSV